MAPNIFSKKKKRYDSTDMPKMFSEPGKAADRPAAKPAEKGFTRYTGDRTSGFAHRDEVYAEPFRPKPGNGYYEPILPVMPHDEEFQFSYIKDNAGRPGKHRRKSIPDDPYALPGQSYAVKNDRNDSGTGEPVTGPREEASENSFEDYYNRLLEALQSYGVDLALPTLEELYGQLESFLRPGVDAAIEGRKDYGDTVLAELDADAYARGMGSSSYLTSMKYREYEDIARDIAALESNYGAALAEYLYDITAELNDIQVQLSKAALAGQSGSHSGHGGGHGHGSGGSGSGENGSSQEQPEPSGTTFGQYQIYFECLTDSEIENFFHSSDAYWADLRNQMGIDLTPEEYQYLIDTYDPYSTDEPKPAPKVPGGNGYWYHTPY